MSSKLGQRGSGAGSSVRHEEDGKEVATDPMAREPLEPGGEAKAVGSGASA